MGRRVIRQIARQGKGKEREVKASLGRLRKHSRSSAGREGLDKGISSGWGEVAPRSGL